MHHGSYEKSARIYDLLYVGTRIKDYRAEVAELNRLIEESCPTARTLLDVACGTGAHLAELRRRYEVEGADLSPAMLGVARERLPGVPLHQADMRELDLGRSFDAVICLFSSIGYVTDPSEMRSTVARLALHVAPGGGTSGAEASGPSRTSRGTTTRWSCGLRTAAVTETSPSWRCITSYRPPSGSTTSWRTTDWP